MICSARLLRAAIVATIRVKISEANNAANILSVVRSAYQGRFHGSSATGVIDSRESGSATPTAPRTIRTAAPASKTKAIRSARLGGVTRRMREKGRTA